MPARDARRPEEPTAAAKAEDVVGGGRNEPLSNALAETIDSLGTLHDGSPWAMKLTTEDHTRLRAAISRRGERITFDEVLVVELVEAVLPESLACLVDGTRGRERLSKRIASTLLDDPVSAARLQRLVESLQACAEEEDPRALGNPPS